ncbi:hypothetical protein [Fluviicola sp.]|uniref:hypothetical protein n=1 Tax=Fluviicola sp. TaxID=1917219 RepID=UPI002619E803|nr:hypothetical protein [Fluviicola sp.]
MKTLFVFTTLFFASCFGYAQTCVVKIGNTDFLDSNFREELNTFLSLEFSINGIPVKPKDSIEKIIPVNRNGFDSIRYSYTWNNQRIEKFSLCKFKPNETYTISPCTCCGIFLMTPKSNAERGFVKFVNRSKKLYLGSASEFDFDSIPPKSSTGFLFSAISMNCGFRPSQITVVDPEYLDSPLGDEKPSKLLDAKELNVKRMELARCDVSFLFLHGEKLVVTFGKNGSQFKLELE